MAVVQPTLLQLVGNSAIADVGIDGWRVSWANMKNADTGAPVSYPGYADKSIQVAGTFGSGGTMLAEGNNDGVNYAGLTDPLGNTISITTAVVKAITEAVINVRPNCSAGDGTTNLTVTMFFRKTQSK